MALRNIVVLGDRVRENLDLTGPMSEDEKARLDTLEGKALAILVLADRDPADSISGLGGVQGLVYTKQCDPALTPFVAHIVREGNALVADVQSRGGVVKPLESYFVNNMTGLGKSL